MQLFAKLAYVNPVGSIKDRPALRIAGATHPTVLFLCADRGTPYLDTVYDPTWVARLE